MLGRAIVPDRDRVRRPAEADLVFGHFQSIEEVGEQLSSAPSAGPQGVKVTPSRVASSQSVISLSPPAHHLSSGPAPVKRDERGLSPLVPNG